MAYVILLTAEVAMVLPKCLMVRSFIYMSKHSDGEAKLHIPLEQRGSAGRIKKQPPSFKDNMAPQVPPKGTNANNQYR
jgi:hypothetical protein